MKRDKICYIFAAMPVEDMYLAPGEKLVIAADVGFEHLKSRGIKPDLCIGDFDSLGFVPGEVDVIRSKPEKDDTDTILAIREALSRGYKNFVIYGAVGGRLDHTYANIQSLLFLTAHDACGLLFGDGFAVTNIRNRKLRLGADNCGVISVFCPNGVAEGVYIDGLKYRLADATVRSSFPIGVSNEFTGAEAVIRADRGDLLVMWETDAKKAIDDVFPRDTIKIEGAIFDLDGTIFDSMCVWEDLDIRYLRSRGVEPTVDLGDEMRSASLQRAAELLKKNYNLPESLEDITNSINKLVEDMYFYEVLPKPGIREFLEYLRSLGVKMCIATLTDRYQAEAALERCGILDYFDGIFTSSEIGKGKGDPLMFEKALEFLGTDRERTVVFEDALYSIKTAKGIGLKVAAIWDKSAEGEYSEITELADIYLESLNGVSDIFE